MQKTNESSFFEAHFSQFENGSINVWKEHLNEDFPIHIHDYSELVCITQGNSTHIIDDVAYNVQAGDVYVIKGNTTHGFLDVKDLSLYNIAYKADEPVLAYEHLRSMSGFQALFFVEPVYRKKAHFKHKLHLQRKELAFAENLLEIMSTEDKDHFLYEHILKIYLTSFITFLSRQYEMNDDLNIIKDISDTVALIERNFTENISVQDLALKIHLSPRHFTRLFINAYGITPKQYILNLRLRFACRQLIHTDKSITQISYDSGFNNSNYFTNYFTKKIGKSPTKFRSESKE